MKKNRADARVWWPAKHHPGMRTEAVAKTDAPKDPDKAEVLWVDDEGEPIEMKDTGSRVLSVTASIIEYGCKAIYWLRGLLLSIPVLVIAVQLAAKNNALLPETVHFDAAGLDEAKNLIFETFVVSREVAVYGPLALTFLSLVLVCMSRRVVYPWVISIMTLLLPYAILIINTFP